ncbi:MAG: biopolymer transporter ExbD [Nitrospirae bacterium]|nr:biopolymer transporter ExbD [Magnetococcales bacterium]HAT49437.1 biopolymer transporter ExbD [Alphaproteobacteria bacterium]
MMGFRRRVDRSLSLDITPLVDVVFLLLIFFMVTTSFSSQQLMDINAPMARTGKVAEGELERTHITVDKKGNYAIDGESVEPSVFRQRLLRVTGGQSERLIAVEADQATPHGAVVFALDEARLTGAKRLAITTRPVPDENSPGSGVKGDSRNAER